jgi:hypothetical protein
MDIDWDGAIRFWETLTADLGGRLLVGVITLTALTPFFKWGLPAIGDFFAKVIGAFRR